VVGVGRHGNRRSSGQSELLDNTAEAVESVIRGIHHDSHGAERVGVVFVQETKHTGEATGRRAGRLGSRLHSLQGFTVLAHKARTIAVSAGVWPGGGGVAIFVHHLLRERVQLVPTNPTPPFEATLTVRVRTGPTHWQFVTNTYFEPSRPGLSPGTPHLEPVLCT
jgi:hypothetical protein